MENFEQRWKQVEVTLQERFGKVPDMEGILFLIGINELGEVREFSKEQKQDLMHIAVCSLLSRKGYYEYAGLDAEGWPHYNKLTSVDASNMQAQEALLKECVVLYFEE
ncbi:MAG: hypothetical protein EOP56_18745 [Sphingobacteriales bacterium]|nr:MAG: hypothetical protein EOP56_18745 [Sphingobacteriales bacterium]